MWPALLAAAPGLLSAGKGIFGMFGKNKNPANKAMKYLSQTPGQTQPYYQPYQEAGKGALDDLQNRYKQMLDNPGEIMGKLGAGYKQSPGYANTLREAMNAANQASAAGGMLGTPQHMQQSSEIAGNVANKDFEEYLNHILGLYQGGLGGEQGIEQQGYGANTDYANLLANLNQQKAGYSYAGQAGKNQANQANWANIFGGGADAMKAYGNYNDTQSIMDWLKHNQMGG